MTARLYDKRRWRRQSRAYLARNPYCAMCREVGRTQLAQVVDHRVPHRGDETLFWDQENWSALCKSCHDGPKASFDRSGKVKGCDAHGRPLDPNHHWNRPTE